MTPERVMEIAREHYLGLDPDHVIAFASRIREEAIRECAAYLNDEHRFGAARGVLSLIEKKP